MSHLHDEPNEQDRIEDFNRQYAAVCHAEYQGQPPGVIFCPWCKKANRPNEPACCGFFTEAYVNYGRKQLASVARQLREIRLAKRTAIHCPYCQKWLPKSESDHPTDWFQPNVSPFCCEQLHDAVLALAQNDEVQRRIDAAKRIQDQVAATSASNN